MIDGAAAIDRTARIGNGRCVALYLRTRAAQPRFSASPMASPSAERLRAALTILTSLAFLACASRSRLAPVLESSATITPADVSASTVVPYPPPPAKVETIPPEPRDGSCVYLDGQWLFGARDWQWAPGGWVVAPPGCAYSPARVFWQISGGERSELRFRPGHWVREDNPRIDCPQATPCPGTSTLVTLP